MNKNNWSIYNFLRPGTNKVIVDRYIESKNIAKDNTFFDLDCNVVVLDVESTGLSIKNDDLIQIAAAKINKGKIVDWFITFVNPDIPITPEISHLTNIENKDIEGAPDPDEAVYKLSVFCGNCLIVAHNTNFDKNMIVKHKSGHVLENNIWIDSLELSRICFPRLNSHRLIDLARAFRIKESTHRADMDVYTTVEIYRICLGLIVQMPLSLINLIANISDIDMWPTSYVFKKAEMFYSKFYQDNIDLEKAFVCQYEYDLFNNLHLNGLLDIYSALKSYRQTYILDNDKKNKRESGLIDVIDADCYNNKEDFDSIACENKIKSLNVNSLNFPSDDLIEDCFKKDGLMGKIYQDFETRPQQISMAKFILKNLKHGQNFAIEAGTGVGKSMSYLIPLIKVAQSNKITIGIATKTNALIDQLIYHELPLLKKEIKNLKYSCLKGYKHYICLRKLTMLIKKKSRIVKYNNQEFCTSPSIATLLSFVEQTDYDDADGIKINARWLLENEYSSSSSECLKNKCPFFYNGCYVQSCRKHSWNSNVVVTNQSLMLSDCLSNNKILPPINIWIVDEAHTFSKIARETFSYYISVSVLHEVIDLIDGEQANCIFNKIKKFLSNSADKNSKSKIQNEGLTTIYSVISKLETKSRSLSIFLREVENGISLFDKYIDKKNKGYEYWEIWIDDKIRQDSTFQKLQDVVKKGNSEIADFILYLNNLCKLLADVGSSVLLQNDVLKVIHYLDNLNEAFNVVFINYFDDYVYSVKIANKNNYLNSLIAQPLNLTDCLNKYLYSENYSIGYTSATLAIGNKFDKFLNSVGLDSDTNKLQLRSSFDMDKNMTIYCSNDMPAPNAKDSDQYLKELSEFLIKLHIASCGSILTLFTNRREMEHCYSIVNDSLSKEGLRLLCQKYNLPIKSIKDEFLSKKSISLFALKSLWEGFDAPGSTLKGVVIPKLPFARPTEPLYLKRRDVDSHAWSKYVLPESIIDVKQAVGRLIRKHNDKGFIVFADSRVCNKWYSNLFLSSMPSRNIKKISSKDIVYDIKCNFNK